MIKHQLVLVLVLISFGVHSSDESSAELFMELVNDHRHTLGLNPMTHDEDLRKIAAGHSKNMASERIAFGHTGFSLRCTDARKALAGGKWCGENVAKGQKTYLNAFKAWMNSPGHRANIEQSKASHTGFAFAKSSDGVIYWTQIFLQR